VGEIQVTGHERTANGRKVGSSILFRGTQGASGGRQSRSNLVTRPLPDGTPGEGAP